MPSVRATRTVGSATHDATALGDPDLWRLLDPVRDLWRSTGLSSSIVAAHVDELAAYFRRHRAVLLAVLFSPAVLLDEAVARLDRPDAEMTAWLAAGWAAEASWRAVCSDEACTASSDPSLGGDAFAPGDHALLRPLAARLRFLVLTEPFRHRRDRSRRGPGHDGWPAPGEDYGAEGPAGRLFGTDSKHLVIGGCREARAVWQRCLDEFQSHLLLASATPGEVEQELSTLVFRKPQGWWLGAPLVLSWTALDHRTRPHAMDGEAVSDVVERHLLPRFRLWQVSWLSAASAPRRVIAVAPWWSIAVVVGTLYVGDLVRTGHFRSAAVAAAGCYAAIGLGVTVFGRVWAMQWLLRLPAASAVGLFVLITVPADWWQRPTTAVTFSAAFAGWPAMAALLAASYGYLVVEARNHGAGGWEAPVRALAVTMAAAVHAMAVCLVGLVVVAPAYLQEGGRLAALWTGGHLTAAWAVLATGAAWCLAVGVFSQILWDDRPITAPLAHLQWRTGR